MAEPVTVDVGVEAYELELLSSPFLSDIVRSPRYACCVGKLAAPDIRTHD